MVKHHSVLEVLLLAKCSICKLHAVQYPAYILSNEWIIHVLTSSLQYITTFLIKLARQERKYDHRFLMVLAPRISSFELLSFQHSLYQITSPSYHYRRLHQLLESKMNLSYSSYWSLSLVETRRLCSHRLNRRRAHSHDTRSRSPSLRRQRQRKKRRTEDHTLRHYPRCQRSGQLYSMQLGVPLVLELLQGRLRGRLLGRLLGLLVDYYELYWSQQEELSRPIVFDVSVLQESG